MNLQSPVGDQRPPCSPAPANALGAPPAYAPPFAPARPAARPKEPYNATKADAWFALSCLLLGFLGVRWGLRMAGWGVSGFALAGVATLLVYACAKGVRPTKESWYWLSMVLLCAAGYALWPSDSLVLVRFMFLVGSTLLWCASLFGCLLGGKTSGALPLDALNLLFYIPFKNISLLFKSLAAFRSKKPLENAQENTVENAGKTPAKRRTLLAVGLGLMLCIPLLFLVLPLLVAADAGPFLGLLRRLLFWLANVPQYILEVGFEWVVGVPLALFICALVAGCAHKRHCRGFDIKKAQQSLHTARVLPQATVLTVLGLLCALYLVFLACQLPYYFSAFAGQRPQGYEVYADYARSGFFELCRLSFLNLALLGAAALLARGESRRSPALRALNLLLSALTLLFLATAFSKMALYIGAYGLSVRRVLTCVFMVFLAVVFAGVMVWQFRRFSLVRLAAFAGSGLLCLLLLCNVEGACLRYNANRYLAGTLDDFDVSTLYQSGIVGVQAARDVLEQEPEYTRLSGEIGDHLRMLNWHALDSRSTANDTLTAAYIRAADWSFGT